MADITFVDEGDEVIGYGSLTEALEKSIVRRVIRVFIFNDAGELLLQKRSDKVLYPHRWNDSVSGHVDRGESYGDAAVREVQEEIGVSGIELQEFGKIYTEEKDHVPNPRAFNMLYHGVWNGEVRPDPKEVAEVRWITIPELEVWIEKEPDSFTPGFVESFTYWRALGL